MSDIVERLRHVLIYGDQEQAITAMEVAAAEIERLRLRVKFLEDELKCPSTRAALEPKP